MALTLRLSEEESKTLKRILPEHSTSSSKLKYMIMSWESLQSQVRILREDLEGEKTASAEYIDQLSKVKGALKVLEFFGKGS